MTNENYLIVSYFCAAAGGLAGAAATALLLRSAVRRAVAAVLAPVGKVFRRVLPAWLVLLVLFAFTSVSYLDCDHSTYQEVVKDRAHMEQVTRTQASKMLNYLTAGLLVYAAALAVMLTICPSGRDVQPERPAKPTQ